MPIAVVNKNKYTPGPDDFYIGRGSPVGNPYTHLTTNSKASFIVSSRQEAIAKYREWIKGKILFKDQKICELLEKILVAVIAEKNIQLVCYCAPQECHGDVIKEIILHRYKVYLQRK